jgi:hypothetical protein
MNPDTVIKYFNIFKYYILSLLSAFKFTLMGQLSFKSMEKTLCNRIIPTIPLMAHTLNNMMLLYNSHMATRSILATTISMPDQSLKKAYVARLTLARLYSPVRLASCYSSTNQQLFWNTNQLPSLDIAILPQ